MCPLRIILIFLSATLAGFFVLRNLKSQTPVSHLDEDADKVTNNSEIPESSDPSLNRSSKVWWSKLEYGFWTCVDMASGRYLWRHLTSSSPSKRSD